MDEPKPLPALAGASCSPSSAIIYVFLLRLDVSLWSHTSKQTYSRFSGRSAAAIWNTSKKVVTSAKPAGKPEASLPLYNYSFEAQEVFSSKSPSDRPKNK